MTPSFRCTLIYAAAILSVVPISARAADAAVLSVSAAQSSLTDIEISGVRLGMTPEAAIAGLAASGMPNNPDIAPATFVVGRVEPNGLSDLTFVSGLASRAPSATPGVVRQVAVSFTPLASRERVWGVSLQQHYNVAQAPSLRTTVQALAERFGRPSYVQGSMLLWYWNAAGTQMGPDQHETCRIALHNAYIWNMALGGFLNAPANAAMRPPMRDWEPARRAGCSKIVRAQVRHNQDQVVTQLGVDAIDLDAAYVSGLELGRTVAAREQQASDGRRRDADARRPTF